MFCIWGSLELLSFRPAYVCIRVVIIVLLPPAITTTIGGITRGITISFLFSIISPVAIDYLSVLLQLLLALLPLPPVLLLRRHLLQGEDLLLQLLIAPGRPLEEVLDTIIVSAFWDRYSGYC